MSPLVLSVLSGLLLLRPILWFLATGRGHLGMDAVISGSVFLMNVPHCVGRSLGLLDLGPFSEAEAEALVFFFVCSVALELGRLCAAGFACKETSAMARTEDRPHVVVFWLIFAAGLAGGALDLVPSLLGGHASLSRVDMRQKRNIIALLGVYLVPCLGIAAGYASGGKSRKLRAYSLVAWGTFGVVAMLFQIVHRSRTMPLSFLALFLLIAVQPRVRGGTQGLAQRLRKAAIGAVVAASVVFVGAMMVVYRGASHLGWDEVVFRLGAVKVEDVLYYSLRQGDLAYFRFYSELYESIPDVHPYLFGSSFWGVFLGPIPRSAFPLKPENTQRIVCSILKPGMYLVGGTIPPSLFGDAYLNFGHYGVLWIFLFGMAVVSADSFFLGPRASAHQSATFLAITAATGFHFARGTFYNGILISGFLFVVNAFLGRVAVTLVGRQSKDSQGAPANGS